MERSCQDTTEMTPAHLLFVLLKMLMKRHFGELNRLQTNLFSLDNRANNLALLFYQNGKLASVRSARFI